MITLESSSLCLRALEPSDIEVLYDIENNEALWSVGDIITPLSKFLLKEYIANAHRDVYEVRQLRLAITLKESQRCIGLIDLFDFDPHHLRAGVGIVISSQHDKRQGYALQALQMITDYAKTHLKIHQVYATIGEQNKESISLFEKAGFSLVGVKKDWRRAQSVKGKEVYINEYLYQFIF